MSGSMKITEGEESGREALAGWFRVPVARMPPEIRAKAEALLGVWFREWDAMLPYTRTRLVAILDSTNELTPDEMQRLFDERVSIRAALERHFWQATRAGSRNHQILDEVRIRQANGERGVFDSVAIKFKLSPKTVRNIVGKLRRLPAIAAARKKTSPK